MVSEKHFQEQRPNCPLLHTENTDVQSGQANGSRVFFEQLHLNPGEGPFELTLQWCGTIIKAVFASQVHSIRVRHENPRLKPRYFHVQSRQKTFSAAFTLEGNKCKPRKMRGQQFPLVSNTATTGHARR